MLSTETDIFTTFKDNDRKTLVNEGRDILVKFYQNLNNINLNIGENKIDLNCQHFINGLFLDNINIEEIDRITLYVQDNILFNLPFFLSKKYAPIKINTITTPITTTF